jgi:hypothetical protein
MSGYKTMKNVRVPPWAVRRVIVYQRKDVSTESYYARFKKQEGGFIYRSLKTYNEVIADQKAHEIYLELLLAERHKIVYGKNTFNDLWPTFIKKSNASQQRKDRMMHLWTRYFKEFFGKTHVARIDVELWESYLKWRVDYWTNKMAEGETPRPNVKIIPTERTIMSEHQILKQFLHWCHETNRIYSVPRLRVLLKDVLPKGKVKNKKTRGTAIPMPMMRSIEEKIRHHALTCKDTNRIRDFARWRLYYYIKILYHSGARPLLSELGALRWKDIEIKEDKHHKNALTAIMRIENGKNGKRTAIMTYAGTRFLLRWRKKCIDYGLGGQEDFLFPNHDGGALIHWQVGHQLRRLLTKWGCRQVPTGENITLYSWRASSITNRLAIGWTIERVSTAFNTSIQSISQSYYHELITQNLHRWANHYEDEIYWRDGDREDTSSIQEEVEKMLKIKDKEKE